MFEVDPCIDKIIQRLWKINQRGDLATDASGDRQ